MHPKQNDRALVALGANLPFAGLEPAETLRAAARAFSAEGLEVLEFSRVFSTPCFPQGAGPDYANAVTEISVGREDDLTSLLSRLHGIEARFGRERVQRWGMRTLDLDLIAFGDSVLPDAETQAHWRLMAADDQKRTTPHQLILPHPRMQDRAFVLVPLADVAPGWRHPLTRLTVVEMLDALPQADRDAVKPL